MADVGGLGQLDLILNLGFLFLLNRPQKQKKKVFAFQKPLSCPSHTYKRDWEWWVPLLGPGSTHCG